MTIRPLFYIIAIVLCQTLFSCDELQYDGKTRLVYEGRVLDDEGQPLADVPVNVFVKGSYDRDIIAYTKTDSNGSYTLIFPKPLNSEDLALQINHANDNFPQQEAYSDLSLYNLKDENLSDYKLTFGDVTLYKLVNSVNLTLNFTGDQSAYPVTVQLLGLVDDNRINYNLVLPDPNTNPVYEAFNVVNAVRKNQVISLKYIIYDYSDNPSSIEETEIIVGEEDLIVTINL